MNHKFWNAGQGKPEGLTHAVKNAELVTIPAGVPVVYAMNGTDDGLAVILSSSSNATQIANLVAGMTTKEIPPGKLGEVQVYGFTKMLKVLRATRAASTDAWPTMASIANNVTLGIDSAANGFAAGGAAMLDPFVVIGQSVAAGPTLASSAGSGLQYFTPVKAFLRFM